MAFDTVNLTDEALATVAALFRSLGEVTRLKLLRLMEGNEMTVGQLAETINTSQANVSKHLKVLINAGVLTRRAQGTAAYYTIGDPMILQICDIICDGMVERAKVQAEGFGLELKNKSDVVY